MWDQVKQALNQSTTKFLTSLAHLLPGIVALIVALLVCRGLDSGHHRTARARQFPLR